MSHIMLRLRYKKHSTENWINRDSTACADAISGNMLII